MYVKLVFWHLMVVQFRQVRAVFVIVIIIRFFIIKKYEINSIEICTFTSWRDFHETFICLLLLLCSTTTNTTSIIFLRTDFIHILKLSVYTSKTIYYYTIIHVLK